MSTDTRQGCLGVGFFTCSLLLPIPVFVIGWAGWNLKVGFIAASATLAVLFLISMILITTIKDPGWFAVAIPFTLSTLYMIIPDFIIGGFDDTAAMFAGVFGSCVLIFRKLGCIPKRVLFPLAVVAIYPIFGQIIPGAVDEVLVALMSGIGAAFGLASLNEEMPELLETATDHDQPLLTEGELLDEGDD